MSSGKARGRGRPPGRTAQGQQARDRLHRTALALIAKQGYAATTLRGIAVAADVSPALVYRYFDSKQAIVMELYEQLTLAYAERAEAALRGSSDDRAQPWSQGYMLAVTTSLEVLAPHRPTLVELLPLLVGDRSSGVLADNTSEPRQRVAQVFLDLVARAADAPPAGLLAPLGRLLYLSHLLIILFWLADRSPGQRATQGLLDRLRGALPMAGLALAMPGARTFIATADALVRDALLAPQDAGSGYPSPSMPPDRER